MENNYQPIKSFRDLHVYQNLYKAMVIVHTKICPRLPREEKYDLVDQMKRASKSAPAQLAEGFTKRYEKKHWHRYLQDSMGEANEMTHHLSVCIDIYPQFVDVTIGKEVMDLYELSCKQLSKLDQSWQDFHNKRSK